MYSTSRVRPAMCLAGGLLLVMAAKPELGQAVDIFLPPVEDPDFSGRATFSPDPEYVTGHLAQEAATNPLCPGQNDVLAVTFTGPITSSINADKFTVWAVEVPWPGGLEAFGNDTSRFFSAEDVKCAAIQPGGDERNEMRTVLLFGSFTGVIEQSSAVGRGRAVYGPAQLSIESLSIVVNGEEHNFSGDVRVATTYLSSEDVVVGPSAALQLFPAEDWQFAHVSHGPFLADITIHDLAAPLNTAAADPNGCAALHPSATYAIRLLFASAVQERNSSGALVPFGTNATAAAAAFSLRLAQGLTPDGTAIQTAVSNDTLVGLADVDGDNVIDLCVKGAADMLPNEMPLPEVDVVLIDCNATKILSPAGIACERPIEAHFSMELYNDLMYGDYSYQGDPDPDPTGEDGPSSGAQGASGSLAAALLLACLSTLALAAAG